MQRVECGKDFISAVAIAEIAAELACVIISIAMSGRPLDFFDAGSIFITAGGTLLAMDEKLETEVNK